MRRTDDGSDDQGEQFDGTTADGGERGDARASSGGTPDGGRVVDGPYEGDSPSEAIAEGDAPSRTERYKRFADEYVAAPMRVLWSDWRSRVGLIVVAGFLLMGTLGVVLVPVPEMNAGPRYVAPFTSWRYPLGTDSFGKGVFAQIVHATPAMLKMILAGALFGTSLGTAIGLTAGYKGGRVDRALMWFTDVMMTLPGLPLVIVLAAVFLPKNPFAVGVLLTINDWAGLSRSVRSQVLTLRDESYVEASRVLGVSTPAILSKDVLPNLMPYVSVNFVGMARTVIFESVGLYFLGVLPFTTLNWGVMMNLAYSTGGSLYTLDTAHWLFFPMLAITLLSLAFILLAQGADRIFNPRIRARHASRRAGDDEGEPGDRPTGPGITEGIRQ